MEMVLVELSSAMALLALGAISLPLSARWLERDSQRMQAFLVPSILSIGITMLFAVGLSMLMASAAMASGSAGFIILGLGMVSAILLVRFGWKLLREPGDRTARNGWFDRPLAFPIPDVKTGGGQDRRADQGGHVREGSEDEDPDQGRPDDRAVGKRGQHRGGRHHEGADGQILSGHVTARDQNQ